MASDGTALLICLHSLGDSAKMKRTASHDVRVLMGCVCQSRISISTEKKKNEEVTNEASLPRLLLLLPKDGAQMSFTHFFALFIFQIYGCRK